MVELQKVQVVRAKGTCATVAAAFGGGDLSASCDADTESSDVELCSDLVDQLTIDFRSFTLLYSTVYISEQCHTGHSIGACDAWPVQRHTYYGYSLLS